MCEADKELRIDRIESGIAVAYSDTGQEYRFPKTPENLREGDIVRAALTACGQVTAVEILTEKTAQVKEEMRARLHKLFKK